MLSHGNGPQVGLLALQAAAYTDVEAYPLDVLGAQTEGMIGYMIEQELGNLLPAEVPFATHPDDGRGRRATTPRSAIPTKFVGPDLRRRAGRALADEKGWVFKRDGEYLRRVVPSPRPKRIFEIRPIRWLLEHGTGRDLRRRRRHPDELGARARSARSTGVEAVIDKDLASELLAREVEADLFIMATDVDGVYAELGHARAAPARPGHAGGAARRMDFAAGSMGPKVDAAAPVRRGDGQARRHRLAGGHREDRRRARPARTSCPPRTTRGRGGPMSEFGVHSEVGKLRKVMVHRPDLSLQRLTPTNHDDLLFDDVLWVERAQYEHDQFVDAHARARASRCSSSSTCSPRALAASDEGRKRLIELVVSEYTVGLVARRRDPRPLSEPASRTSWPSTSSAGSPSPRPGSTSPSYAKTSLIGAALDDTSQFVLPPLPNTLFTRDSSCWIYGGVSINPMYWPARRREAYNVAAIYRAHPMFPDADFEFWYPPRGRRRPARAPSTSGWRRSRVATSCRSATAPCSSG